MNTAQTAVFQHLRQLGFSDAIATTALIGIPDHMSGEFTSIDFYLNNAEQRARDNLDKEIASLKGDEWQLQTNLERIGERIRELREANPAIEVEE